MTSNGKIPFLNIEQLVRCFAVLWKTKEFSTDGRPVPAAVLGPVGSGKTTAAGILVDSLNKNGNGSAAKNPYHLWKVIVSVLTSSDFGVPYPTPDGKLEHLAPNFLPFDSKERGVLLFDEFDRGKPDVQNSALQILLGGELHGHEVSPNIFIILTMNGISDIFTTPLSEAARTRVCSLFVSPHAGGAGDSWDDWAADHGISPMMRGFAKFRPDLITAKEEFEELAIPTPRTRDMADWIMKACEAVKFETNDIMLPLLAGVIGKAAAIELIAFRSLYEKCPDPDEVLADPTKAPVPEEQSVLYALGLALLAKIEKDDREKAIALVKYAVRMPEDKTAFVLRKLGDVCPTVVSAKEYLSWVEEHKMILL